MLHNPIYKVLSILEKHKVKTLLIGGQATIIYGAAEFSRDIDIAILLDRKNLNNLKVALKELKAKQIYYPPLERKYLQRGHACHYRCNLSGVKGFRVDLMAKLRGCSSFNVLWKRRKIYKGLKNIKINVISLKDLVQSKKTQRDKDWFMINRLMEVDILNAEKTSSNKISWWFAECRSPELLIELAQRYPDICKNISGKRPLLMYAMKEESKKIKRTLLKEEETERKLDKKYWDPLKKELEQLRHSRVKSTI